MKDKQHCAELAEELIQAAKNSCLTKDYFKKVEQRAGLYGGYEIRNHFVRKFSWLIPTEGWLNSLAQAIKKLTKLEHPNVLEVCAGKGVLSNTMTKRGVKWICTDVGADDTYHDAHPPHVSKMDAMNAIDHIPFDLLFVSWIPYESKLDYQLAQRCYELQKPMILVGEGCSGCTGSYEFWGRTYERSWCFDEEEKEQLPEPPKINWNIITPWENKWPWFEDIPQWSGIHDGTYLVLPKVP